MDNQNQNSPSTVHSTTTSLQNELAHAAEEMYKKNLELAMTNKTLSLLHKLNTIILSSVTDIRQVSQQVVDIIVAEADFKRVSIYICRNKEELERLAASNSEAIRRAEYLAKREFPSLKISLQNENNLFVRAFKTGKMQITNNYFDLLLPDFNQEEASLIQSTLNVKSVLVYPLIVRNEAIGALSINLVENVQELSVYEQDLINRLVDVIGIAIDSSLLYQSIQEANEKLKELDYVKDEFVSLASHELRTPMTVIKSTLWLLLNGKSGEITPQQRSYLETSYSSTERLIHLVNDMLDISRIESGRTTVEKKTIDLGVLLADQVNQLVSRGNELGIKLEFTKPNDPLIIQADAEKINQVLINLIGNSLKFTPRGGSIIVTAERKDANYIRINIKDTGRGLNSADITKLFQKFSMIGDTHLSKEKGQGTGLGLYLCKSLIELHGGKIWAESEGESKGTTFSFTIPQEIPQTQGDTSLPHQSNPQA